MNQAVHNIILSYWSPSKDIKIKMQRAEQNVKALRYLYSIIDLGMDGGCDLYNLVTDATQRDYKNEIKYKINCQIKNH